MRLVGVGNANPEESSAPRLNHFFFRPTFFFSVRSFPMPIRKKKKKDVKLDLQMVRNLFGKTFPVVFPANQISRGSAHWQRDAVYALDSTRPANLDVIGGKYQEGAFQKAMHAYGDFIVLFFTRKKKKRKHTDACRFLSNTITFVGNDTDTYRELGTYNGPMAGYHIVAVARDDNDTSTNSYTCLGLLKPVSNPQWQYYQRAKVPVGFRWHKTVKDPSIKDNTRIEFKNDALAAALKKDEKIFNQQDLTQFNVTGLTFKHYIKATIKNRVHYFEPVEEENRWTFDMIQPPSPSMQSFLFNVFD
jgi:hypothetical protein